MAKRPRRLHRKLSPNGASLFRVVTSAGTFQDSEIYEMSITGGTAAANPDISPSTAEFTIESAVTIQRDTTVHIQLADWFAQQLGSYGGATAAQIQDRFKGRKGLTEVEDKAWKIRGKADFKTIVSASSWTTLLRVARRTTSPVANENMLTSLLRATNHPSITPYMSADAPGAATYDYVFANDPGLTFEEVVNKYGTDLGTFPQHRRNGSLRFLSIGRRRQLLTEGVATQLPLLRSQGISPAQWSQSIESASNQLVNVRRLADGSEFRQNWPLPDGTAPVLLETQDVDMLHARIMTENYRYWMNALNNQANSGRMELQSVTIDLIMLLSSKKTVDRRVGTQLLALNPGDLIYLSYDWPVAIQAPYYANQIKETITPDSWTLELSLYHPRDVVGTYDGDLPEVPARVWDSAVYPWNSESREWNKA